MNLAKFCFSCSRTIAERLPWLALVAALASVQCTTSTQRRPQVNLFIDTDATVPQDTEQVASESDHLPPLVDVARVEILDRATGLIACDACRRDIALDEKKLAQHGVSFGIVQTDRPVDVRVRMFLLQQLGTKTEPPASITIEARSQVARAGDRIVTQWVFLPSDSWGAQHPNADPPHLGDPPPSRVGTWPKAQAAACTRAPRADGPLFEGERCIPGGAFTRSNQGLELYSAPDASPLTEPRVVALSPILMDRYEYTVGRYLADAAAVEAPSPWSYSRTDPDRPWRKHCTLGSPRADAAALPLNCVSWETATRLCEHAGGRLPTESELEFAATGRGEDRRFVWGWRAPHLAPATVPGGPPTACCDALIAARETEAPQAIQYHNAECSRTDSPPYGGARSARVEAVDFVERAMQPGDCRNVRDLSRDGIVGLQGSLMEWAMDTYATVDDACWNAPLLRIDPVCTSPPNADPSAPHTAFGSHWADFFSSSSRNRTGRDPSVALEAGLEWLQWVVVGFRCVRAADGEP